MKVIVICQYSENYSDNPKTPFWKKKGSHEFVVNLAQCDIKPIDYINSSFDIDKMIQDIVNNESNEHCKYTVLSITPQFSEPTDITEKFKAKFYAIENFKVVS